MIDDDIRSAIAVARSGSFTAAASHLGLTQSAVTKRVADLEHRLGCALFNRTSRGVILTDDGSAFIDRATGLLEEFDHLMMRNQDPYAGPLRVGVCPAALDWVIVKPIVKLTRRHPQVRLDVNISSAERIMHLLRNGRVDVAVGLDRMFAEHTEFRRVPLATLEARYFARRGHPLEHEKDIPNARLAEYNFVLPSGIPPYALSIRQIFESVGIPSATRFDAVDYFPLVQALIKQSDNIGVVSTSYTNHPSFGGAFAVIDAVTLPPPGDLCCAVRTKLEPSTLVKAFIQACRKALAPIGLAA